MKEVMGVVGGIAALIIVLTILGRGGFKFGTGITGPYADVSYSGR